MSDMISHNGTRFEPMQIAGHLRMVKDTPGVIWGPWLDAAIAHFAALPSAQPAQGEAVAWMDDGTIRSGSEATRHRVVTDEQKRGMHDTLAASFMVPLYAHPPTPPDSAELDALMERMREWWEYDHGHIINDAIAAITALRANGVR